MNKKIIKILKTTLPIFGAATIVGTIPAIITSCNTANSDKAAGDNQNELQNAINLTDASDVFASSIGSSNIEISKNDTSFTKATENSPAKINLKLKDLIDKFASQKKDSSPLYGEGDKSLNVSVSAKGSFEKTQDFSISDVKAKMEIENGNETNNQTGVLVVTLIPSFIKSGSDKDLAIENNDENNKVKFEVLLSGFKTGTSN